MIDLIHTPGFLGTKANILSDATLILMLVTIVLFTIGWRLAVSKHYLAHRIIQTFAASLNAIGVLAIMISSFVKNILPGLPAKLFEGSYGITTFHAVVGAVALTFGIYVVLTGNELIPKPLRFSDYKSFMRASFLFYILATFVGIAVYIVVFHFGL